jgi:hypothetical protein
LDIPLPHEEAAVREEPIGDRAGGEEKACKDSWKTFVNPMVALYRIDRSLSNGQYPDKPDGPYTGSLLQQSMRDMSCHTTNQHWSLRFLWMSKWGDKETDRMVYSQTHRYALKQR